MLNFQRTIIFCVLFAAVWVQSTKAELTDEQKREIEFLEKFLKRLNDNRNLIPTNGIDHFRTWGYWERLADSDRMVISERYHNKLALQKLKFGPEIDEDVLVRLAYEALDEHIEFLVQFLPGLAITWGEQADAKKMKKVAKDGEFLKFIATKLGTHAFLKARREAKRKAATSKVSPSN